MKALDTIISKSIKKAMLLREHASTTNATPEEEDTNLYSILKKCKLEAQQADETGIMPSPKFFQQAAVLSRKEKKYENEIAICKSYINLVSQYAEKNKASEDDINSKVNRNIDPFNKRISLAEANLYK